MANTHGDKRILERIDAAALAATARSLLAKLLLAAGSTLLALLLAELMFRLISREEVKLHGLYTGADVVGVALTPGFRGSMRTSEFEYAVSINEHGMRDHPVAMNQDGTRRILVIGDSFVFGVGVELEDSLPKALERRLDSFSESTRFQVFNGGVPGYGSFQELHNLRRLVPILEPDLVVLVFFAGDDWFGNVPRKPRLQKPQVDFRNPREWFRVHSALFRFLDRFVFLRLKARDKYDIHQREPSDEFRKQMLRVLEIIAEMRAAAVENDGDFLIALNPRYTQTYDHAWKKASLVYRLPDDEYSPFQPNLRLTEALKERGFWVVDLLDPLREKGTQEELHFPIDGHWNPKGNEFVASVLAEAILPRLEDEADGVTDGEPQAR